MDIPGFLKRRFAKLRASLGPWQITGWILGVAVVHQINAYFLSPYCMYPTWALGAPAPADFTMPGLEKDWLPTEQGRTKLWILRGKGASPQNPAPVVFHAHGNGELIEHWLHRMTPYQEMGITVVFCEYRGYGDSDGPPLEAAIIADFARAYTRILQRPDIDPDRIFYHGRSMGGAVLTALAMMEPPKVLILESTFLSARGIGRKSLMLPFMIRDQWDTLERLPNYEGPVLVLHGQKDMTVRVWQARELARIAQNSHLVIYPKGGHNNLPVDPEAYWKDIRTTLIEAEILPNTPPH